MWDAQEDYISTHKTLRYFWVHGIYKNLSASSGNITCFYKALMKKATLFQSLIKYNIT